MRFLLRKALAEAKWLWLACALGLFSFSWLRVWLVSQLEMSAFRQIILALGDEFEKFLPVSIEQLFSYLGRIARSYSEPIITVCLSGWATARGSDVVSGELSRGTLEMVLAQPVSRRQLIWSQCIVTTAGSLALCTVVWLGIWAGIRTTQTTETVRRPLLSAPGLPFSIPNPWGEEQQISTPMRDQVRAVDLIPGSVNLFCLAFFIAGLATWMSSWDRYRWRTIGLVIGLLLFQSTLLYFAISLPSMSWLGWLTAFTAYNPERFIADGADRPAQAWQWLHYDTDGHWDGPGGGGANLLLLGLGLACYLLASRIVQRRDLPAPL